MINLIIKADIKKATRALDKMGRRQVPFATSVAINKTAVSIQRRAQSKITKDLDRPSPQVIKSIRVKRSTKRDLTGIVFILPAISRFLRYQIEGGTRPPRGKVEAVPVNIRLNKYGNIIGRRQGKLRKLLSQPDIFSGTINGVAGIWQRGKGGLKNKTVKLLAAYESSTQYDKRFPFYRYADDTAQRVWRRNFRIALARALRG